MSSDPDRPPEGEDATLLRCLEDYEARRRTSGGVRPEDYLEQLGAAYERFRSLIGIYERVDEIIDPGPVRLRKTSPDRYREFRPVGEGGMGLVYWAIDSELNREVALKAVKPLGLGESIHVPTPGPLDIPSPPRDTPASQAFEALKQRFLQEAWVTSGMTHPGILPVYELAETPGGIPYYTMRFVKGERTLEDAIRERHGAGMEDRLALLEPFLKVCDTLGYAHSRGIVHRDLKPQNVALGEFGEVLVLDWGLAKLSEEDLTQSVWQARVREYRDTAEFQTLTTVLGTPGYMSPEAARADVQAVDEKSDVYSLGVILFEILTGRMPFSFDTYDDFLDQILHTDPPRAEAVAEAVPRELSDLCQGALARDKARRLGSVGALARRIRAWQAQRAVDREVENLLRDAEGAMRAAEEASGQARLRHADRAAATLAQVTTKRPESDRARALGKRTVALREQGIREREKANARRLLVRIGVGVLAVAAIAASLVARTIDQQAREAERERDAKGVALAQAEEERAKAAALEEKAAALRQVEQERDAVLRLSDAKKVRDLLAEAHRLWPVRHDVAPRMERWLARAEALVADGGDHEAALAAVRERRIPRSEEEQRRENGEDLARLEAIARRLDALDREAEGASGPDTEALARRARTLLAERDEIEFRVTGRFTDEDAWRHQVLADLLGDLSTLTDGRIEEIAKRKEAAWMLRRRSIEDHEEAWHETIEAIAASEHHAGLLLSPQEGLVPLGPDPDSGLFEFGHLGSGSLPARDEDTGQLAYADDSAIVLVLIPGGTDLLGAQKGEVEGANHDPQANPDESPVHEVTLSPFFLAKHEVTQAQWAAMTGQRPSVYGAGRHWGGRDITERNPVEQVSWEDCHRWLTRHRLSLPTEAQWEYACRAGTNTPWFPGREAARLGGVANIADAYFKAHSGPNPWRYTEEVDDGHSVHAPVGSFSPNAFGLFDVHGNVHEWCLDVVQDYPGHPQADPVVLEGSDKHAFRGGSYVLSAWNARSAARDWGDDIGYRLNSLGVRPAGGVAR